MAIEQKSKRFKSPDLEDDDWCRIDLSNCYKKLDLNMLISKQKNGLEYHRTYATFDV